MVRAELQDDLADIFRRLKKTVVIVTHDMNEAAFFADQIILLRAGQIVQAGTPVNCWITQPMLLFRSSSALSRADRWWGAGYEQMDLP